MKYTKLCALLALSQIDLHSNILGTKKPVAKLDEEQLQTLEDALAGNETYAEKIKEHEATIDSLKNEATSAEDAISAAISAHGIELEEGASISEKIAALDNKCKEYGNSNHTHSIPQTDGKETKNEEEDPSANYEHNKVMQDNSKFTKIV